MKAGISVALFCETCNMALEQVSSQYVQCVNRACTEFGLRWEVPKFDLAPYEEPSEESGG